MAPDALAPCVARTSAAMILTIEYVGPSLTWGRTSSTCVISMWRNDTKCKYMFMFLMKNLANNDKGFLKVLLPCGILGFLLVAHRVNSNPRQCGVMDLLPVDSNPTGLMVRRPLSIRYNYLRRNVIFRRQNVTSKWCDVSTLKCDIWWFLHNNDFIIALCVHWVVIAYHLHMQQKTFFTEHTLTLFTWFSR